MANDIEHLFQEILEKINKMPKGFIIFKKIRNADGWCDYYTETIEIDFRKESIPIIIHEMIHLIRPNWSEKKVLSTEKKVISKMKSEDVNCLIKCVSKKLF